MLFRGAFGAFGIGIHGKLPVIRVFEEKLGFVAQHVLQGLYEVFAPERKESGDHLHDRGGQEAEQEHDKNDTDDDGEQGEHKNLYWLEEWQPKVANSANPEITRV